MRRTIRAFTWIAIITAIAGFSWSAISKLFGSPFGDRDFDRAMWVHMRGSNDPDNPRGQMVEDLVDDLEARRPLREEVIAMLGSSEFECSVLSPPVGATDTCLSYNLGMWSGFRMDYDTLDVYFEADGRVLEAVTVQH